MEQFLEQTIVLLEIHCYLLCSAESTLDWIGFTFGYHVNGAPCRELGLVNVRAM